jgi:hypothetical protein
MPVAFPGDSAEYRAARNRLVEQEIELRRAMETVADARRRLPPGGVAPADYRFQAQAPDGTPAPVRLSELFTPGKNSLVIYSMMFSRALRTRCSYGWARVIAVREAVRIARRSNREHAAGLADLPQPGDPMLAVEVRAVLERLAPEHRAVLMLRDLEGIDEHTAALLLGIPVGTVKPRLSRPRDRFRKEWAR